MHSAELKEWRRPHLCDPALHNQEVGIVDVQLNRMEEILHPAATTGNHTVSKAVSKTPKDC